MIIKIPNTVAVDLWQIVEDRSGDTDAIVERILKYFMENKIEEEIIRQEDEK